MAEHDCNRNDFLQVKFQVIDEKLDSTNKLLERILEQTSKTNGRVTALEYKFSSLTDKLEVITIRVDSNESKIKSQITALEQSTSLMRFVQKYPRLSVAIALGLYLVAISDFREVVGNIFKLI